MMTFGFWWWTDDELAPSKGYYSRNTTWNEKINIRTLPHQAYCIIGYTACSFGWWLMAGAGLFWEKSTADWLLVAGLLWEKSTAGWWLIRQANKLTCYRLVWWSMRLINTTHSVVAIAEATEHQQWRVTKDEEPKPEYKTKDTKSSLINCRFLKRWSPLQVSVRLLL
jgi:hypothetical protein